MPLISTPSRTGGSICGGYLWILVMPTDGVACEDATARDELGLVLGRQLGGFARSVRIPSLKTHGKR